MYTKRNLLSTILAVAILLLTAIPARPATEAEIEAAINGGIGWLVANQNGDGSWGTVYMVGKTGLAVVKLQDRAREVPTNEYDDDIQEGLDYIFNNGHLDAHGPGTGITFTGDSGHEIYQTGIAVMAIANDGDLTQTVGGVGPLAGMTSRMFWTGL